MRITWTLTGNLGLATALLALALFAQPGRAQAWHTVDGYQYDPRLNAENFGVTVAPSGVVYACGFGSDGTNATHAWLWPAPTAAIPGRCPSTISTFRVAELAMTAASSPTRLGTCTDIEKEALALYLDANDRKQLEAHLKLFESGKPCRE